MRSRRRSWTSAGSEGSNSLIGRQSGAGTDAAGSRRATRRAVMATEAATAPRPRARVALNAEDQVGEHVVSIAVDGVGHVLRRDVVLVGYRLQHLAQARLGLSQIGVELRQAFI